MPWVAVTFSTIFHSLLVVRPITIVSGPEIMDKFVGSSEKNLREIFDNPPDIYDTYRLGETDNGVALAKAALHVIGTLYSIHKAMESLLIHLPDAVNESCHRAFL